MRCELCQGRTSETAPACAGCGARLDEERHRELYGVRYLLGQLYHWGEDGTCPTAVVDRLRADYSVKRDRLRDALKPASPAKPAAAPVPSADDDIIEVIEDSGPVASTPPREPEIIKIIEEAPRPIRAPAPVRQTFAWRDLFTERNIRWLLNLGIFIFSVALAVFIYTQWTGMTPVGKTAILFGSTLVTLTAGHLLRKTILSDTGMALIILGAIALPIDFLAMVRFELIKGSNAVGLVGSITSLGLYLLFARIHRVPVFAWLATGATACATAFALATTGLSWNVVPAWTVPILVGGVAVSSRLEEFFRKPAWFAGIGLSFALTFVTLALLAFGEISIGRNLEPLEVSLASIVALALIVKRPWSSATAAAALGAMFWLLLARLDLSPAAAARACGLFGAALLLGARGLFDRRFAWHALPFVVVGIIANVVGAANATFYRDWFSMAVLLAANGAVCLGLARWTRQSALAHAGLVLLGLALASWANGAPIKPWVQPLLYAGYGLGLAAGGRYVFKEACTAVSVAASGIAMFLLSIFCMQYFHTYRGLGAAISLASATSLAIVAHRLKSRFVADLAYGSVGFAYFYGLLALGVPSAWTGPAIAAFAFAIYYLEGRLKLLRPTLFTGVAAASACTILAFVQWLIAQKYLPSACSLTLVAAFFLTVGARTPHRWVLHIGTYLAAFAALCFSDWAGFTPPQRLIAVLPVSIAALVVAHRKGELQLGAAGLTVHLALLAFAFIDPAMYERATLPYAIGIAGATSALAAYFAFVKPERVDLRAASGVMGAFASLAYILFLKWMSTGSAWGGVVVLLMAFALSGAAWLLRRDERLAHPLLWVGMAVGLVAVYLGHFAPKVSFQEPAYLFVYASLLGLHGAIARVFKRIEFEWGAAISALGLGLSLHYFLDHFYEPWAGVFVIALTPLAWLARRRAFDGVAVAVALTSIAVSWASPLARMVVLLESTAIFSILAVIRRRPWLMYLASTSMVALDVALMQYFQYPATLTAVQLLTLALVQVCFFRMAGERAREFALPLFVTGLAVAAGVFIFGLCNYDQYVSPEKVHLAIWGMLLAALVHGVAGRIKKIPFLIYIAAGHLLGAYYLSLHKYSITTMEFYTLPLGVGLIVYSLAALREKEWRVTVESVAVGAAFLPSAVLSFWPERGGHTLAALVLAVLLVLAGMVVRRRVFLIGGTICFVAEVLGKAIEFLVRAHLPLAQWGMILGGLMIFLAAAFELRKVRFIRAQAESLREQAKGYLAKMR